MPHLKPCPPFGVEVFCFVNWRFCGKFLPPPPPPRREASTPPHPCLLVCPYFIPAAVDVLGRSWDPFDLYPEYYSELLPCVGQPSCTMSVDPDWWAWEQNCPTCANCPECFRQLRITYS